MVLDEREQKMLGVYTMVVLIGEAWKAENNR